MIYILHIDPPLAHARHYVGWTKDVDVTRRVNQHLKQSGRRPSKLIGAAIAAGCQVTLAGVLEGDREFERRLKRRGSAKSYCPKCREEYNAHVRARRLQRKISRERVKDIQ